MSVRAERACAWVPLCARACVCAEGVPALKTALTVSCALVVYLCAQKPAAAAAACRWKKGKARPTVPRRSAAAATQRARVGGCRSTGARVRVCVRVRARVPVCLRVCVCHVRTADLWSFCTFATAPQSLVM
jgi:hypothetical protein